MTTIELDELGVDLCAAGLVPWRVIGRRERTEVVRRLTELRLPTREIALRLGISARTVYRHRAKSRAPQTSPPPTTRTCPTERTTAVPHTIEEIRDTAMNLITDMQSAPDLGAVRSNCITIATTDPLLAAQVMMTLAAWLPLDATPKSLHHAELQLEAERNAFHLELVG